MGVTHSSRLISYSEAVSGNRINIRQQVDLPIGHAVSLMLPTLRFGIQAYAAFASPTVRNTETEVRQGAPDRWWVLDARSGTVALFSLCSIYPFSDVRFETEVLPRTSATVTQLREEMEAIRQQMDLLVPAFFEGMEVEPESRARLLSLLKNRIPALLWSQHQALAPEFLSWIGEE